MSLRSWWTGIEERVDDWIKGVPSEKSVRTALEIGLPIPMTLGDREYRVTLEHVASRMIDAPESEGAVKIHEHSVSGMLMIVAHGDPGRLYTPDPGVIPDGTPTVRLMLPVGGRDQRFVQRVLSIRALMREEKGMTDD